ncbi:MAG: GAF domain-containing protein [Terriglobia bacterium]
MFARCKIKASSHFTCYTIGRMETAEAVISRIKGVLTEDPPEHVGRLRRIAEIIRVARGYHWLGLYEVGHGEIEALTWTPEEAPPAHPRFPVTEGLCGAVVKSGETVVVGDITKDARYLTTLSSTRSEIIVPIRRAPLAPILGLMDAASNREDYFTNEDRAFLEQCSTILAEIWR